VWLDYRRQVRIVISPLGILAMMTERIHDCHGYGGHCLLSIVFDGDKRLDLQAHGQHEHHRHRGFGTLHLFEGRSWLLMKLLVQS